MTFQYTEDMDYEYYNQEWTEEELDENETFIKNHLNDNASLDGCMFETYGEELEFVMAQDPLRIWTYQDDDNGNPCITSGFHLVNRIGYLISEKPLEENMNIYVRLENIE